MRPVALEDYLQRELDETRITDGRCYLAEIWSLQEASGLRELRMVENVEYFRTELNLGALTEGQGEVFKGREVEIHKVRPEKRSPVGIAQSARCGLHEATRVEEIVDGLRLSAGKRAIANLVRTILPRVIPSQGRPRVVYGGDEKREPGSDSRNSIDLPVAQHGFCSAMKVFAEPAASAKGQIVNRTGGEVVPGGDFRRCSIKDGRNIEGIISHARRSCGGIRQSIVNGIRIGISHQKEQPVAKVLRFGLGLKRVISCQAMVYKVVEGVVLREWPELWRIVSHRIRWSRIYIEIAGKQMGTALRYICRTQQNAARQLVFKQLRSTVGFYLA